MSLLADRRKRRIPWHLWLVGALSLVWNSIGAFDYLMTSTRNEQYMGRFSAELLDYFYAMPVWAIACWAIAVWSGVLGSIFLLLRKRLAVWALFLSFLTAIATTVYGFMFADRPEVMNEPLSLLLSAMIVVLAFVFFFYAGIMNSRNILR
ncbi:hypothetical protein H2508_02095 [Parahaliea sp. F7430]|uniref:Sugar transporter n=1 Tax=Sediminihaliea albiluteola TaxID=2758564 RepID=A0A7W2TTX2_9GAMM|nr:hypothetical protein [Sediminihaliea albiluteola]MBA6411900.1 hypothetical protein [Sediminihaliea albiluteola]